MKITLKNVKYSEFASHETNCFQAKVYVDGKALCIVSNQGTGGCNNIEPLNGQSYKQVKSGIDKLNKVLAKEPSVKFGQMDLTYDFEFKVLDLLEEYLEEKEVKRILKRISWIDDTCNHGEVRQLKNPKPSPEAFKRVKNSSWWKSDNILLNELPMEEVKKHLHIIRPNF